MIFFREIKNFLAKIFLKVGLNGFLFNLYLDELIKPSYTF